MEERESRPDGATTALTPKELLLAAARRLQEEFRELRASNPHSGERGAEAEIILGKFLQERLPRRFGIESGVIVGRAGAVSRQIDLIVYDALNNPVYRAGPRVHIIPRDSVAAVIEVKSKLNKDELADAATKIASVKTMKTSPISASDQPVTFGPMIMANTLGCVFAYDSYTSLDALGENLRELNESRDSRDWIDLVVVLGKGTLGYALQLPFSHKFPGIYGGVATDDVPIFPIYIHLAKFESSDLALNEFFLRLMAHLAFFRKRTTVDIEGILGADQRSLMTLQGYQYNLSGSLVPAEGSHREGSFEGPSVLFNVYSRADKKLLGQVGYWKWQDGAVLTCSVRFDHKVIFAHYFQFLRVNGQIQPSGADANLWLSNVLKITVQQFVDASRHIHDSIFAVRHDLHTTPPATYAGKPPPRKR